MGHLFMFELGFDEPRQLEARKPSYDVKEGSKVLTREQVLVSLQQSCPDALATFPAPEAFEVSRVLSRSIRAQGRLCREEEVQEDRRLTLA